MSTTSCPRCSAQVTLPVGVSNDATVRCPLCHAHYTLADALVNMPPLLEVVGVEDESLAGDWLDEPATKPASGSEDAPVAMALPVDEIDEQASEAETLELGSLELGSLELDDEPAVSAGQETVDEDLGFSTIGSPGELEPLAALPAEEEFADDEIGAESVGAGEDDDFGALGGEELSAGPAEEDDLPLEFGEELSAEEAGAETLELGGDSIPGFAESDAGDLKFDLDAGDDLNLDTGHFEAKDDDDLGATLDFGATVEDQFRAEEPAAGSEAEELNFDSFDAEGETVQFEPQAAGFGGEEGLAFDDPLASGPAEGEELREFEDLRFEPSGEAADAPEVVPVAPVMAVAPVEAVEATKGKKGKKEKKKKEKKVKVVAEGGSDRPKRSLVGILVGALIAIPAALYGALWLGRDYDLVGLSNYLPAAALPAEYSKKTVVAQNYIPPSSPAPLPVADEPAADDAADETATDESSTDQPATDEAAGDESTAHTTARPATDDSTGVGDEMPADGAADEAPSLAEPTDPVATDAAAAEEMPADAAASPADDLFAPASDTPAEETPAAEPAADAPADRPAENDPFGAAADAPATEPAAESDPFAPAADAPATDAPADDPFGAADAPAEAMPGEEPAAPAENLFAPTETEPATPAGDDLFAPEDAGAPADEIAAPAEDAAPELAPADAPADAPAESDLFAPEPAAESAAPPADITRPAAPETIEPEPVMPAEEMPAGDAPVDPLTDAPAEADMLNPAPAATPDALPAPAADDSLTIPAEPAAPELPVEAPAEPAAPAVEPATEPAFERVGPRNVPQVSPAELSGAMQSAFVAGQQLVAAEAAADEAELRKARAAFYVNLFGMADAITAAQQGAGAAELDPQLQQLGSMLKQQLAADPRRLEALKVFGARWIGFPKRTTNGVVVSGTVESAERVGQLFHTKARLGSAADAPLVTIVSAVDPQLASGDTVVALGSIVERPVDAIAGYQGNEPSVVWSGMAMKVIAN